MSESGDKARAAYKKELYEAYDLLKKKEEEAAKVSAQEHGRDGVGSVMAHDAAKEFYATFRRLKKKYNID